MTLLPRLGSERSPIWAMWRGCPAEGTGRKGPGVQPRGASEERRRLACLERGEGDRGRGCAGRGGPGGDLCIHPCSGRHLVFRLLPTVGVPGKHPPPPSIHRSASIGCTVPSSPLLLPGTWGRVEEGRARPPCPALPSRPPGAHTPFPEAPSQPVVMRSALSPRFS